MFATAAQLGEALRELVFGADYAAKGQRCEQLRALLMALDSGALTWAEISVWLRELPAMRRPDQPGRHVDAAMPRDMPRRPSLRTTDGEAYAMHAVGQIELQAAELNADYLLAYPAELAAHSEGEALLRSMLETMLEEWKHFGLCQRRLQELGTSFGALPLHFGLWHGAMRARDLEHRITLVARVFEASGIDAGFAQARRLQDAGAHASAEVVLEIAHDEISHVRRGAEWLDLLAPGQREALLRNALGDPGLPGRSERLDVPHRREALFTDVELSLVRDWQARSRRPK